MLPQLKKSNSKPALFNKEKKEIMGALFDHTANRAPAVPPPIKGSNQEYMASATAWTSQSKRVRNCATSIELLYKDITRLNLLLRFLKSPNTELVVKARLFTCVDIESKLSKLLWKFNNNTVIRCDLLHVHSLPPLSDKERKELSQPSHPHQTPGFKQNDKNQDVPQHEEKKQQAQSQQVLPEKTEAKIQSSHVLSVHEFYYLFLFLEDKLPELASWLMSQSNHNQNNMLLRALSAKKQLNLLHKDEQAANPLIEEEEQQQEEDKHTKEQMVDNQQEEEEEEEEEKKEELLAQQAMMNQPQNLQRNEIEDECCIICFEKMSNPVCLSCGHEYCKECIDDWQSQIGSGKECPVCRCMIEQSQMWVKLDSEEFSKVSYMKELLEFPVAYISKFATWQDTMV